MKIVTAATVAALLMCGVASAQTTPTPPATPPAPVPASTCGELPTLPTPPDGATANNAAMQAFQEQMTAADTAYRANIQCRRDEAQGLQAQASARASEYNAGLAAFNAYAAALQVEIDEFNARPARSRR